MTGSNKTLCLCFPPSTIYLSILFPLDSRTGRIPESLQGGNSWSALTLRKVGVKRLIDIRLNNTSQLAGFTKKDDLKFFLRELCTAEYIHEPLLAPTPEILNQYKKKNINWQEYEQRFLDLMAERKVEEKVDQNLFNGPTVLLCSESKADHCHRRLVLEYLQRKWAGLLIVHI